MTVHDFLASCYQETINIRDVARGAALFPNRVTQDYRETFGVTPYQEVRRYRMLAARRFLLASDGGPITVMALSVAYESVSAFSVAFKDFWGVSPQAMRRADVGSWVILMKIFHPGQVYSRDNSYRRKGAHRRCQD